MGKKKKKQSRHLNYKSTTSRSPKWPWLAAAAVVLAMAATGAVLLWSGNGDEANKLEGEQYVDNTRPVITIEMEGGGVIKVELDPVNAPNTVRNFMALAEEGFYDGLIFHRVIPGFMIQGGCPQGTGMGGPGYNIRGEFSKNGHENTLKHERGVISMARSQKPDSAGSQFFITVAAAPHLDGDYAAFGTVIEGMDIAGRIAGVRRNQSDRPFEEQRIKRVTVEKFGADYGPPEKL